MAAQSQRRTFRFHFGQRVRIKRPHPDSGATGQVIAGRRYADGRQVYSVDVPGGAWTYDSANLEPAEDPAR